MPPIRQTPCRGLLPAEPAPVPRDPWVDYNLYRDINSLPPELLEYILSNVPSSSVPWRLMDLALVCRTWCNVVKRSAPFWANVLSQQWCLPVDEHFLDMYETALERSDWHLLEIALDMSAGGSESLAEAKDLLSTLMPHAGRLVSLNLVVTLDFMQELNALLREELPLLEEITLADQTIWVQPPVAPHQDAIRQLSVPLPPASLPHLHALRIVGSLFGPWIARPTLQHLTIGCSELALGYHAPRVWAWDLLNVGINQCLVLETLHILNALPRDGGIFEAPALRPSLRMKHLRLHDTPDHILLYAPSLSPLPPTVRLDVVISPGTSSLETVVISRNFPPFFNNTLFELAFFRQPHGRVELDDASLRVYTGESEQFSFSFSPESLDMYRAVVKESKPKATLGFPAAIVDQIARRCSTGSLPTSALHASAAEVVLDVGAGRWAKTVWQQFFEVFQHAPRVEVRVQRLHGLLQYLAGKDDTHGLQASKFPLELVIVIHEFAEVTDGKLSEEMLGQKLVRVFEQRRAMGGALPGRFLLRYSGGQHAAFEAVVTTGVQHVIRDVSVQSL